MFQSSWWEITTHIISLAIAYALALPVGRDRENDARSAGIRTFPLVAIDSCGFVLVGIAIIGRTSPAKARLLEGLIMVVAVSSGVHRPVGWERENDARSAGNLTFPLVSIVSFVLVSVGIAVLGRTSPAQARLLEGLITGVGFIGGGAILKKGDKSSGTATAASLWATGALGAAVGYGLYDIAFILSATT